MRLHCHGVCGRTPCRESDPGSHRSGGHAEGYRVAHCGTGNGDGQVDRSLRRDAPEVEGAVPVSMCATVVPSTAIRPADARVMVVSVVLPISRVVAYGTVWTQ